MIRRMHLLPTCRGMIVHQLSTVRMLLQAWSTRSQEWMLMADHNEGLLSLSVPLTARR